MEILQWPFALLTICGCWRPPSWSVPCKKFIYHLHTSSVLLLVYSITIAGIMNLALNVETADDFSDNIYLLLPMIVSCCKMFSVLINQGNIVMLMSNLREEPFLPTNNDECEIQKKYEIVCRSNTKRYTCLVETSVMVFYVYSLCKDLTGQSLILKVWLPYDYSPMIALIPTWIYQAITFMLGSLLNVACDSLIIGLYVYTVCQIELLQYRLKNIQCGQKDILKNCVLHHEQIYRFAELLNGSFEGTILIQFTVSALVICFNLYQLSNSTLDSGLLLQMAFYMSCMLVEIFIFCWFATEVTAKSLQINDAVMEMNLTALDQADKNIILILMQRANIPIEFSSLYIVSINMETFVAVLKTSFSAYNLLKTI